MPSAKPDSFEHWQDYLRAQATSRWGDVRVQELETALLSMAAAISRVAERVPRADSVPHGLQASAPQRNLRDA